MSVTEPIDIMAVVENGGSNSHVEPNDVDQSKSLISKSRSSDQHQSSDQQKTTPPNGNGSLAYNNGVSNNHHQHQMTTNGVDHHNQEDEEEEEEEESPEAGRLYIGNLPYAITSAELSQIFGEAGDVISVEVMCVTVGIFV